MSNKSSCLVWCMNTFFECISHISQFNVCMWATDVSHKTKSDGSIGNVMFCACGCPISDLRRSMWEFANTFQKCAIYFVISVHLTDTNHLKLNWNYYTTAKTSIMLSCIRVMVAVWKIGVHIISQSHTSLESWVTLYFTGM